jgi:hypothetical protein
MTMGPNVSRLGRMVSLLLTIMNGEHGKTYWQPQIDELYNLQFRSEAARHKRPAEPGVLQDGSMPERMR